MLCRACGRRPLPLAGAFFPSLKKRERRGRAVVVDDGGGERRENRCLLCRPSSATLFPSSTTLASFALLGFSPPPGRSRRRTDVPRAVERENRSRERTQRASGLAEVVCRCSKKQSLPHFDLLKKKKLASQHRPPQKKKKKNSFLLSFPTPTARQPSWGPPTPPTRAASSSS